MQRRRVSSRGFYYLRQLRNLRRALAVETITTLVQAFIINRVDYCNNVLHGESAVHLHSLQSVLNAAARIIVQKRKFDPITVSTRDELHWLPFNQIIEYKLSVLVFKCLRLTAPPCVTEQCIGFSRRQPSMITVIYTELSHVSASRSLSVRRSWFLHIWTQNTEPALGQCR